jgi:hypothetical protein
MGIRTLANIAATYAIVFGVGLGIHSNSNLEKNRPEYPSKLTEYHNTMN